MKLIKKIRQLFNAPERLAEAVQELSLSLEMLNQNRHREITVQEAMDTLIGKLRSDDLYRLGWKELIAIYFIDTIDRHGLPLSMDDVVKCANEGAARFLQQLTADQ